MNIVIEQDILVRS